jgi:hypothetical protein
MWRRRTATPDVERRPVWSILAVVFQIVAIVAAVSAFCIFTQPESLIGFMYAVPTYAFFAMLGTIAAFVAVFRREQWPALSWVALFLNGVPFVIFLRLIIQKVSL